MFTFKVEVKFVKIMLINIDRTRHATPALVISRTFDTTFVFSRAFNNVIHENCKSHYNARYTCNFCCDFTCDFLLLMDVNEWLSNECSYEGTYD